MPGAIQDEAAPQPTVLNVKELHPTFGAEITDFLLEDCNDVDFQQILALIAKYGFLVFRNTGLTDTTHVAFSRRFGDLDDIRPYMVNGRKPRYEYYELFDAGNIGPDGRVLSPDDPRAHYGKGNAFFHVDSSFNPRRASYSLLRAERLPPEGMGGNTDFADSRSAFETLPEGVRGELMEKGYVGCHSLHHSRKRGSPGFFADLRPEEYAMMRHRVAQVHEPSGRMNLYIGAHLHHIEGLSAEESWRLVWMLTGWATRPENTVSVAWKGVGDLIIWDNTAVMHRAAGGTYEGKFARDLRRTTVHDASSTAWGLNGKEARRPGFDVVGGQRGNEEAKPTESVATLVQRVQS